MRAHAYSQLALAAVAALAIAPMAALAGQAPQPGEGEQGLGLRAPKIPVVLQQARSGPYAPPAGPLCATAPKEIAELDAVLGPDADAPRPKDKLIQPTKWVSQAVRSAIPHRDVVRFITGADRKQKLLYRAEMAGWARRGYLKGLTEAAGCAAASATFTETAFDEEAETFAQAAADAAVGPAAAPGPILVRTSTMPAPSPKGAELAR